MQATETNTIRLTDTAIEAVKKNLSAKNRLQFELEISFMTIQRWLKENNTKLTTAHALKIISEETGISQSDLLSYN